MEATAHVPTYEIFFVLESFHGCFAEYVMALRPLRRRLDHGLLGCDVYYREDTDVALLALRFDERALDAERLAWLLDFAGGAGLAALDPTMLPIEDRRRFYQRYLEEYPLRAENRRHPEEALQALADTMGLRVPRPRVLTPRVVRTPAPTASPNAAPAHPPRGPGEYSHRKPAGEQESLVTATWRVSRQAVPEAVDDQPTVPSEQAPSEPAPRAPAPGPRPAANQRGAAPARHRVPRASPVPIARVRLGSNNDAASNSKSPRRGARPPGVPGGSSTSSSSSTPTASDEPPRISVRFRRGDEWIPARLRSLGLKGAYLACGAVPRLHDDVHIALGLDSHGTVLRGSVVHLTGPDAAGASGASGFGVLFPNTESPARRQLKELLQEARKRGVVLEPPPPRCAVRFPVHWPVHVVLPNQHGVDLSALDISAQGMFLSTLDRLPTGSLEFYMPTELGGAPIHGHVRAVREVPWKMACSRGLHSGFGMQIVDFSRADDDRYAELVQRVGRRVQRRILVGASPDRSEVLTAGLAAAGYTVTGATDANTIIELAESDPRAPDAALLDSSLELTAALGRRIEQLLALREVPLIQIRGEPASRARSVMDSLLAVHQAH